MPPTEPHVYDPHEARCVSWNDLRQMVISDGPTRANFLTLVDCLQHGPKEHDTRRAPVRTAPPGAPASHDSVVTEVMNRIGSAIGDQIRAAMSEFRPAPNPAGGGNGGGNGGDGIPGGNGGDAKVMEAPPVPVNYGDPRVHQPSEVFGAADEVDPKTFEGIPLAADTTTLKTEPQPVPLSVEELAQIRSKLADKSTE